MKDRLFLLKPGFTDQGAGPFFCNECALVEGMLSYFPDLRKELDVTYVEFQRPRPAIVKELGPDHQSAPVLVLGGNRGLPPSVTAKVSGGKRFIDDEHAICLYLAAAFATPRPHH